MKNEEAIASLRHMRDYKIADKEAIDIAISALEFHGKRKCMNCILYIPYGETEGACCNTHHLVDSNFFCKWWRERPWSIAEKKANATKDTLPDYSSQKDTKQDVVNSIAEQMGMQTLSG